MFSDFALAAALAGTLPGLAAWLAARRWGLAGLMGALLVCAIAAFVGWHLTRQPLGGQASTKQAGLVFLVALPASVSLVMGAVFGFWAAHQRRISRP